MTTPEAEFEIAFSVMTSISEGPSLEEILMQTLRVLVRKLNLKAGAVFALPNGAETINASNAIGVEPVPRLLVSIPKKIERIPAYQIALARVSAILNDPGEQPGACLFERIDPSLGIYIMKLPQVGLVLLIKAGADISPGLLWSLSEVNKKWAQSANLFLSRQRAEQQQLQAAIMLTQSRAETQKGVELKLAKEKAQNYLDIAGVILVAIDAKQNVTMINRKGARMLGYPADEIVGKNWFDCFIPERERASAKSAFEASMSGALPAGESAESADSIPYCESNIQSRYGDERIVGWQNILIPDESGGIGGMLRSGEDVTDRRHAENSLERFFALIPDMACIASLDGHFLRVNPAWTSTLGYAEQEILDAPFVEFIHPDDREATMSEVARQLAGEPTIKFTNRYRCKDGGYRWLEWWATPAVGNLLFASARDITDRRAAEEEIYQLAFYDPLTGLPNRRLLRDRLQQALVSSSRHKHLGALMLLDMDDFKTLNDTRGHDIGDLLLMEVTSRLASCVRTGDTVARLGGDEFVVILEGLDQNTLAATQAEAVGLKILGAIAQPFALERCGDEADDGELSAAQGYHCTSSIGITMFRGTAVSVDELMKRADTAMYQAKAAGRGTQRFFDPEMQAAVTARAALDNDLREAIRDKRFMLHYQPQVDCDGLVTGAEALVRWRHLRRGMVSPAEFIPQAEFTGMILAIGHWVLETACAQLLAWSSVPEMSHLTLAVNVSARQFHHPDFVDQVMAVLDRSGADPQRLKLELTESLLLEDIEDIIKKMNALKARGVGFSLDDFGTGYSSLSYLKRLPLDQLKIDQSFVRDVLIDSNDAVIAKTIVALAQSLGLGVIAEGVETGAQRDFLSGAGCHAYQGFFFCRPLPIGEFEEFVRGEKAGG